MEINSVEILTNDQIKGRSSLEEKIDKQDHLGINEDKIRRKYEQRM